MLKKQYRRHPNVDVGSYFNNFLRVTPADVTLEDALKEYCATVAKSKQPNSMFNIKWHDEQLYMLFVLRYS